MTDKSTRGKELTAALNELARQQIGAVKNATFLGWNPSESAAYDKRSRRIRWLRGELEKLDIHRDNFIANENTAE